MTEDRLLGGRVLLRQPANGARAAIDPVFLAAAVAAAPGQLVLDLGCGTAAAALCLAARLPDCRVIGLELQRDLVRFAADNAALNGVSGRVTIIPGDLLQPPPRLSAGMFDHVMANPPFRAKGSGTASPDPAKAMATIEGAAALDDWVRCAVAMAGDRGSVTFIHRADRIDALLGHLAGRVGEIVIFPLWPMAGRPASRILVRARKQTGAPVRLLPGLVLHETDGRFTGAAQAVLRDGAALALSAPGARAAVGVADGAS
jgi:tRNA1(Val) A37 N6-methylase TrmN6